MRKEGKRNSLTAVTKLVFTLRNFANTRNKTGIFANTQKDTSEQRSRSCACYAKMQALNETTCQ